MESELRHGWEADGSVLFLQDGAPRGLAPLLLAGIFA